VIPALPLALLCLGAASPTDAPRPNFVVLFADDAGYADFGVHGSTTIRTPRIDSIAEDGVRFEAGYVTASVCSPSRAGLLTGRYQQRFGHEFNIAAGAGAPQGLPTTELTIADLLGGAGYATGLVGKWHLGEDPEYHPCERGFDEFFGMLRGSNIYVPGAAQGLLRGTEPVAAGELPYLTDAFGDEACRFIRAHAEGPFFLFVSFTAPHTPMQARAADMPAERERFETKVRATYAAMMRAMDDNVGKVLDQLQTLDLADRTLVVFVNDNGGAMPYNASLNAPYSGTKGTFLEGGVRVPFFARWPGHIAAGTTFAAPVSTLDLLPTMVKLAGGALPDDRAYDGVDLMPHLAGTAATAPHEALFWRLDDIAAIRKGPWKLVRFESAPPRLHDLARDPSESKNLAEDAPERVAELLAELERWEADTIAPLWNRNPIWRAHTMERYDQAKVDTFARD